MLNIKAEAERLRNDPDYLRRKAAYLRKRALRGGLLAQSRRDRADELEYEADRIAEGMG